jgi:hypothetical protein
VIVFRAGQLLAPISDILLLLSDKATYTELNRRETRSQMHSTLTFVRPAAHFLEGSSQYCHCHRHRRGGSCRCSCFSLSLSLSPCGLSHHTPSDYLKWNVFAAASLLHLQLQLDTRDGAGRTASQCTLPPFGMLQLECYWHRHRHRHRHRHPLCRECCGIIAPPPVNSQAYILIQFIQYYVDPFIRIIHHPPLVR